MKQSTAMIFTMEIYQTSLELQGCITNMKQTSSLCSDSFHSNIGKSVTHRIECLDYISEENRRNILENKRN